METTEYSQDAQILNRYTNRLTAPIDWAKHLEFLGGEIKNEALQGMQSDGAKAIRDNLIEFAHA